MPKLTGICRIRRIIGLKYRILQAKTREERGSTLVGAAVICAVMSIGVAGLMLSLRNTAGLEAGSLADAEAFLAAESGLLLVTAWAAAGGGDIDMNRLKTGGEYPVDLGGGVSVKVGIDRPAGGDRPGFVFTDNRVKLYSTASHPDLPYEKRLEWLVEVPPAGRGAARKTGWREVNAPKR